MNSGYPGDESRRGRVTAGYGRDRDYRPEDDPEERAPGGEADDAVPPGRRPGPGPVNPYSWPGQEPHDPAAWPAETYREQGRRARDPREGPGGRGTPGGPGGPVAPGGYGGRSDLSDLWRDPDPWSGEAGPGPERRGDRDEPRARDPRTREGRAPDRQAPERWAPDRQAPDDTGRRGPQPTYGGGHVRRVDPGYPDEPRHRDQPTPRFIPHEDPQYEDIRRRDARRDAPRGRGPAAPRPGPAADMRGYGDPQPRFVPRPDPDAGARPDLTERYQNPAAWDDRPVAGGRGVRDPEPPARRAEPPARDGRFDEDAPGGQRAWWDDAFRPGQSAGPGAAPSRQPQPPQEPPRSQPRQPRLLPPGPPGRPGRPARPRPASARGYGVPPGELTQPIPVYQPQGAYIAPDTYEAEDLYQDEDLYEDEAYAPERPYGRERAPVRERPAPAGLARSTGSMAIGTLISRVTGFLRTFVFAIALGDGALANAYNNANTIPNAVYDVMIGGVLTSVVVPLLVKAAREHRDGGEAYNQRMFTLTVFALGAVTVVATVAAGLLVALYAGTVPGTERNIMVVFAYFFIPQIFFYGMSSLIGAILNTRNSFSAPMWTPIINNVIVIVVGLLFILTLGVHREVGDISSGGILLLGVGTTLGIIVQTVALVPSLRRVGFRWRPRFDFRRAELAEIGRMAVWMLGYVVSTQIGFIVTTRVANTASVHVQSAGVTAYNYSYSLFLMPYAIIGVSVTTALLPRMSRHAAEGRFRLVRDDFSHSVRLSSVILAPAALLLAVLGAPVCELLFSYGHMSIPEARYIGEAFAAFSLGLLPFVIFQLLLRVFYALHDSRTPAIIGFWTMLATVAGNYLVLAVLPSQEVVIGMAFVYGLTSIFSAAIAWRLLARRFGGLDGPKVTRSLVRMHVAAIPALVFAFVVSVVVSGVFHPGAVYGFVTVLVGGGGALLLYVITARALRLDELAQVMRMVTGRFGGRGAQGAAR